MQVNSLKFPALLHHVLEEVFFSYSCITAPRKKYFTPSVLPGNAMVPKGKLNKELSSSPSQLPDCTEGAKNLPSPLAAPPAAPC